MQTITTIRYPSLLLVAAAVVADVVIVVLLPIRMPCAVAKNVKNAKSLVRCRYLNASMMSVHPLTNTTGQGHMDTKIRREPLSVVRASVPRVTDSHGRTDTPLGTRLQPW